MCARVRSQIVDSTPNPSLIPNNPAQTDAILASLRRMPADVIQWYKREEIPEQFHFNKNVVRSLAPLLSSAMVSEFQCDLETIAWKPKS